MGRIASPETQLRKAERENRALHGKLFDMQAQRDTFRSRVTRAEQEVAEWKSRFDRLLERTPKINSGAGENHG